MNSPQVATDDNVEASVTHGYANSDGVQIHYASMGAGPPVIMIHGFPDYWYTWRHQMAALAPRYQLIALDQRGYNLSDKPAGGEHYAMRLLVGDVAAVMRQLGHVRATVVGHDWGGMVAWQLAIHRPELVERLVVLNLPHPNGLARELAHNPQQQQNSQYARDFQQEGAHLRLSPESLSRWVGDPAARARYLEAFRRSDAEAMLHYYKQNYPHPPYAEAPKSPRRVQAPTLLIHGLRDEALLASGLNDTWQWMDSDLTIVTMPGAGHFVQHDAPELVTRTIASWLAR